MPQSTNTDLSFLQKCTAVKVSFGNLRSSKKLPRTVTNAMVSAVEDQTAIAEQSPDDGPEAATSLSRRSDPSRLTANKKLWQCKEAKDIFGEFTRLRTFVTSRTLPSPFGKGIYFVPNTLLGEVDAELTMSATQTIPRLCDALIAVYDRILATEETALGANFNPHDYETPSQIRDQVTVDYFYTVFGIPESLPNAMYKREQEKAQSRLSEAVDTMQALLRAEMDKLLGHAVDALTGTRGEGKPKIFRDSLTDNIRDFLRTFKDRDITDDTQLQTVCDQVKRLLDGVDPKDLRKQEPLRESTAAAFAQIRQQLDGMLVQKGSRQIRFEEDETADAAA